MTWWRRGVIYEIYPRSFQDSDGDGIGDLRGVTQRLPYLRDLGVDAIWLTPIYQSPQRDFGYDISDHCAIDPQYGSMEDFEALTARAHELGLKVLLDYVPNHTSDLHPWFEERPDFYLWHDGPPPNNWIAVFGGPAWEQVGDRSYYHAYLREQPDLNWRNPAVREAMYDVLRFWIDRGVDGFRVDALRQLLKDPQLRDNPPNPDYEPGQPEYDSLIPLHTTDLDELQEIVAEMRAVIGDRLMIAEVYVAIERLMRYYGDGGRGAQLPFNFHLLSTEWTAEAIGDLSSATRRRSRPAPGRTGCSATTIARASRAASGRRRRASRRCSCSPCAARRRSTTATSSGCPTRRSPPIVSWIPPVATPSAYRCRGMPTAASPPAIPGCRSAIRRSTWPRRARIRGRCSASTGGCWRCAARATT